MTATTETIPGTDQIDRTDQNRPAGEAADVGPVSAPSPGEDRWDQEDAEAHTSELQSRFVIADGGVGV